MRFRFCTKRLQRLYTEGRDIRHLPASVVEAFLEVMLVIEAAPDERTLYEFPSLRFEKLKGRRKGQRSLRLNDQFRLTLTVEQDEEGSYLLILGIEDYH